MSSFGFLPACPSGASLGKPFEGGMAFSLKEHWSLYTVQSFDSVHFKGNILKLISQAVLCHVGLSFVKPGLWHCEAKQLCIGAVPK